VNGSIDGTTQPGYTGTPLIELDGSLLPSSAFVLTAGGGSCAIVIKALVANRGARSGFYIFGPATLLSSYSGIDPTGKVARPNVVGVDATAGAVIGGTGPGEGNLISGNLAFGIRVFGPATIQGNRIGTDLTGMSSIPNQEGVEVEVGSPPILIGGTALGAGNLISGNGTYAIDLFEANDVVVQGNNIGPDAAGGLSLPRQAYGVNVYYGSRNTIGGPSGPNIIAHNAYGVRIQGISVRNRVSHNSIYDNFGIDLAAAGDGNPPVTPNDPCDSDTGPNLLLNYPVLTSVSSGGGQTTIAGTLNSEPNATYTLEFFWSPACDSTGFGAGKSYLGSLDVATDSSCIATFSATFNGVAPPGGVITATSTDIYSDTSEFSRCLPVTPPTKFYTLAPCRVVDTRNTPGSNGGPALQPSSQRNFPVSGLCSIPSTAVAIAANIAVTEPQTGGHLVIFPGGTPIVSTSSINFGAGKTRANNAILALGSGSLEVSNGSAGTVHFILDVNGYFQ